MVFFFGLQGWQAAIVSCGASDQLKRVEPHRKLRCKFRRKLRIGAEIRDIEIALRRGLLVDAGFEPHGVDHPQFGDAEARIKRGLVACVVGVTGSRFSRGNWAVFALNPERPVAYC